MTRLQPVQRRPTPRHASVLTRRERVRLLLETYIDALGEGASSVEGHGELGSRVLMHSELHQMGSYGHLSRCLEDLKAHARSIHWHTIEFFCRKNVTGRARRQKAESGLDFLTHRMPRTIYVPQGVSEGAGFPTSEAKAAATPRERREAA